MKKIWLSPPHISGNELQKIQQVFQENWIAPVGPQIGEFEAKISSFLGNRPSNKREPAMVSASNGKNSDID